MSADNSASKNTDIKTVIQDLLTKKSPVLPFDDNTCRHTNLKAYNQRGSVPMGPHRVFSGCRVYEPEFWIECEKPPVIQLSEEDLQSVSQKTGMEVLTVQRVLDVSMECVASKYVDRPMTPEEKRELSMFDYVKAYRESLPGQPRYVVSQEARLAIIPPAMQEFLKQTQAAPEVYDALANELHWEALCQQTINNK
jgi:hypothetical protein